MRFRGEYNFLSNFYPSPLIYKGKHFPTSEHAYQAAKAVTEEEFEMIRNADTPGHAKKLGQQIEVRDDWIKVKRHIMREILEEKFSDPELREKLLDVEGPITEENTWNDTYWGICNGKGSNHLGKILMRIRNEWRFFS